MVQLAHIEDTAGKEPEGNDQALIAKLDAFANDSGATIQADEEANNEGSGDSAQMQALFDATPSLVDMPTATGAYDHIDTSADSAEMQALFDATPSLVASETPPLKVEERVPEPSVAPKESAEVKKESTKPSSGQSIRVSLDLLEHLMQQASELVLTRNQLLQMIRDREENEFTAPLQRLNYITTELQEGVMKTRMQPISSAWTPLPRIVRDLARDLGKNIELVMEGGDTELDRQLLEYIKDPLTHMVRNSVDHGLEMPQQRRDVGKKEQGTIRLSAFHEGGYIIIRIQDDGKGLDPEKIREKVVEKELATEQEVQSISDKQLYQYIFKPGFSTAAQVTAVSGRGVGMDVVRTNIENIGGSIELDSSVGQDTCFTIKIPLTLAIMSVLVVEAQGQRFALSQISISEIVRTQPQREGGLKIDTIDGHPVLKLRGRLLPLQYLSETLHLTHEPYCKDTPDYIVICEAAGSYFGVVVDKVFNTEEIVVKPLAPMLASLDIYAGITILGDGKAVLLLDANGLSRQVGGAVIQKVAAIQEEEDKTEVAQFVKFRLQDETPKVVPMELVSRLEEIEVSRIEYANGRPVLQYRDQIMHLKVLEEGGRIPQEGMIELLVTHNGHHLMGLVVREIEDIVRANLTHEIERESPGFMGSIVIDGKACDIVDVEYHFVQLFGGEIPDIQASLGSSAKKSNTPPVVLFVEDSPFFRKFILPEFEAAGFTVLTANQGEQALKVLEANPDVALIVTDMNMPGMNGIELLAACRADERWSKIPVIVLSSHQEEDMTLGTPLEGIFAYVSKTNQAQLMEKVLEVLG